MLKNLTNDDADRRGFVQRRDDDAEIHQPDERVFSRQGHIAQFDP